MAKDVDFVLSSNPPNPRTSFRQGDWLCSSPKCAAHNFGRNLSCIGCGSHKSPTEPTRPLISSPRFSNPAVPSPTPPPADLFQKPSPHHPLLTPSGRAFAVGGKVQNISSDPLNPCIMFWPDNEPLPDQGQIRPSGLVGIPQPPILNTGNRGPISHQPGDWVCQKCNYLNWRRRKVCQTCLPYAEGNGDSISAAVQAERIALLTNVLARSRLDVNPNFQPDSPAQRSLSLTPPTLDMHHVAAAPHPFNKSVQRSRSHLTLGQQYQQHHDHFQVQIQPHLSPAPIYQTSPAPPRFGPELMNPSSLPHPQLFQNYRHRNPSPLTVPLLYSTGPPASPFLGVAGYRMRVLSSPAPHVPRDWTASSMSSPRVSGSGSVSRSSISSLGSLDIPPTADALNGNGSGSELPTPAITSPLLPAFLRDVVSKNGTGEELFVVQSPTAFEGVDLSPEVAVRNSPSPSYAAPIHRARNDSGSSTCSTSSSSSSSSIVSTSGLSLSLSATSLASSSGCGGALDTPPSAPVPRSTSSASSSSPTITTTVSSCPTPPADKGSAKGTVPTSTSSLPFMSFGNAGIWKMDGEESRSLKGFTIPPAQPNLGIGRNGVGGQNQESQAPLLLPVAAEKRQ